ncbi:MAG TPA: choice-of-anchor tandem repeat GloVer-containing protein [Steroidobacteraceae bacterium]
MRRRKSHNGRMAGRWPLEFLTALVLTFSCVASASTPTYNDVYTFETTGPYGPYANVVQGPDGNLYGTTAYGGTNGQGTVYRLTPAGTFKVIYNFCSLANCTDGREPQAPLVFGTNGDIYGTTGGGGSGTAYCGTGCGTVFKLTPKGILSTLHNFCSVAPCDDGSDPSSGLVQGRDGSFYGVTSAAGGSYLQGTVYRITPAGVLTTLYAFCIQTGCTDGESPRAGLIQGTNGQFYGTTGSGGQYGYGEIFEITMAGKITVLHSFDQTDGEGAFSSLVQASNGFFYGTTQTGGSGSCAFGNTCGTVYKMNAAGKLTTLVKFTGTNGSNPEGLVEGSDGNLYGITAGGGSNDSGTFFKMSLNGNLSTPYNFCAAPCTDGYSPDFAIILGTSGLFYGVAPSGENGNSVVFSIDNGLAPFLNTQPIAGKVGAKVNILGNNLTGATAVSFNGTNQPDFTVVSATEITTTVPTGATTGIVEVTAVSGVLSTITSFEIF